MTCFEIRYIQKKGQRQRMEIAKFSWNVIKTGMIKETKHFSRVNAFRAVFTENRKPRLARQKRLGQQETTTPDHHRNRSPPHCSSTRQIEKKKRFFACPFACTQPSFARGLTFAMYRDFRTSLRFRVISTLPDITAITTTQEKKVTT